MRFLNTTSLKFEEVPDSELDLEKNNYAILSHRWGADEDEVSYNDMINVVDATARKAFTKIKGFCELAASLGCRYGWVDTCCINKGNSSELAEAINSMYLWYKSSTICIVYLQDVPRNPLIDSEWFDRGWTLQELIAPQSISFFDYQWTPLGTKTELLDQLADKTRIPIDVLNHTIQPSACSVAQRMSWAANRRTKRTEDRAYSLMGLFDINMPMIYGERDSAFMRLQQHIIQKSKDESIFAWAMEPLSLNLKIYTGLYAPSPSVYEGCDNILQTPGSRGFSERNGELSIHLTLSPHTPGIFSALLHCMNGPFTGDNRVSILLARTSIKDEFVRIRDPQGISRIMIQAPPVRRENMQLIQISSNPSSPPKRHFYGFRLRNLKPPGHSESNISILSNCPPPEQNLICQESRTQGDSGIVHIAPKNDGPEHSHWSQIIWMKFGFNRHCKPVIWLANKSQSARLQPPFERAFLSQEQGKDSEEHKQVMETDTFMGVTDSLEHTKNIRSEWPEGRAFIEFPDYKRPIIELPGLGIKISARLLNYYGRAELLKGGVDDSGLPLNPMLIWTVDITETERKITPSKRASISVFGNHRDMGDKSTHDSSKSYGQRVVSALHLPLLPSLLHRDKKEEKQARMNNGHGAVLRVPHIVVD